MSIKTLERIMKSGGVTGVDIRHEEGMFTISTRALSPVDEFEGIGSTLRKAINALEREILDAEDENEWHNEQLEEWAPKGSDFL